MSGYSPVDSGFFAGFVGKLDSHPWVAGWNGIAGIKEIVMKHRFSHKSLLLGSVLLFGALSIWSETVAAGGDAAAGEKKSMFCSTCHGADGNATHTGTPRLAGQSIESFVAKMKLYKSNQKVYHPMMAFLTGGLNDQDIQDLAAFYAKQPIRQSLQPYRSPAPAK